MSGTEIFLTATVVVANLFPLYLTLCSAPGEMLSPTNPPRSHEQPSAPLLSFIRLSTYNPVICYPLFPPFPLSHHSPHLPSPSPDRLTATLPFESAMTELYRMMTALRRTMIELRGTMTELQTMMTELLKSGDPARSMHYSFARATSRVWLVTDATQSADRCGQS